MKKTTPQHAIKLIMFCLSSLMVLGLVQTTFDSRKTRFDAYRAFNNLAQMQAFGPRVPGSLAHDRAVEYISRELTQNGWTVEIQSGSINGHEYNNILARKGQAPSRLLLGSHYDSRLLADSDPDQRLKEMAVPGANDGGSSSAILLELARVFPEEKAAAIELAFFDIEDQGKIEGWDWILGSREFARRISGKPEMMVLLDMVGGHLQTIQPPVNSDKAIYNQIQSKAKEYGYGDQFLDPANYGILDDHVPFLEAHIPSVDLIDIIDPHWHTVSDDLENVNLRSLQRIGDTLTGWIESSL